MVRTVKYVVVASVVVPYRVKRRSTDEEADIRRPIVVVGASAKFPSESAAVSSNVFPKPAPDMFTLNTPATLESPVPKRSVKCCELIRKAPTSWVPVVVASVEVEYFANIPSNVEEAEVRRSPTVVVGEREI